MWSDDMDGGPRGNKEERGEKTPPPANDVGKVFPANLPSSSGSNWRESPGKRARESGYSMEGKEKRFSLSLSLSLSSAPFKLGPEASSSPQRCPFSRSERCSLPSPSSSSPFDEKEGQSLKRLKRRRRRNSSQSPQRRRGEKEAAEGRKKAGEKAFR